MTQTITPEDHEAIVRMKMAEAERNGRKACRLELEWECGAWGMTLDEINQCTTFNKLLTAFGRKIIHDCTKYAPRVGDQDANGQVGAAVAGPHSHVQSEE